MFETQIGPTGKATGYMRPETAQGIFVNFRRLLEFNGGRMPFAGAQIGLAFRNEISPRAGLLRVREFPLAEIEHFLNPKDKSHVKFHTVKDYKLMLLSKGAQDGEDISVEMTAGDAVTKGIINNETLAYFLCRTHKFLTMAGVKADKLRFRQHKDTEMAHYATDCWDGEIFTTYGWIECVGHADRSAYDLSVHSARTKVDLSAQLIYDTPILVEKAVVKPNNGILGKVFKKTAKALTNYLKDLEKPDALALKAELEAGQATVTVDGTTFELTPEMVEITLQEEKISVEKYLPGVIEPSFGIGRIMYAILEHSYTVREKNGEKQGMLQLTPLIAPVKCALLPIGGTPEFFEITGQLEEQFVLLGLASKVDPSGASIGRKYARADEIGVPFAITVDFASLTNKDVTIRDRDTTEQIRVPISEAAGIIQDLCSGRSSWSLARAKYVHFEAASA
jgi:glycyl-tRNA synthetase